MKQVLQDLSSGESRLVEAPAPGARPGHLLIDTTVSLISTGTERMLVDFGRGSLVGKALQQPERVAQVLDKARTDGLLTTVDAVRSKLAQPLPLGYCNVGVVRAVGAGVEGFRPGDRVASNGPHADVVRVPRNLCAAIPDGVTDEAAAFTVPASIGLQGIRLAAPTLGEAVAVVGTGLIGLLTVQLLRAQGCRVLAIDMDPAKLALARGFGAETCNPAAGEDPVAAGLAFGRGAGMDAVIVTASTKSSDPIAQAARMSRRRGRIVLVGVTGLSLDRADFYEKELTFQVSCSYGPGRYDPDYEERGNDYPIGFVRWTEGRNFEAVLDMLAAGRLDTGPLVSHRFAFEEARGAYAALVEERGALGIVLRYDHDVEARHARQVALAPAGGAEGSAPAGGAQGSGTGTTPVVGFVGAGNYGARVLIPAFKAAGARLHTLASSGGTSAVVHGARAGFLHAGSDAGALLDDGRMDAVAIVTRHDTHAALAIRALEAGKHVFVEKPLALDREELAAVEAAHAKAGRVLMVGFNRRFAPQVRTMKRLLDAARAPKAFVMTMNAGAIAPGHWTQDPAAGGGRIVGEACHYVDLMRHLAGAPIVSVQGRRMEARGEITEDKAALILGFADGSFGTIHYLANGGPSFPKERIEVFCGGATLRLDNFLRLRGYDWPGFRKQTLWRQDKGQKACAAAFLDAVREGGPPPIAPEELFEVALRSIEAAELLREQG